MSWHRSPARLGSPPPGGEAAHAVATLTELRLGDVLAHEALSCGQLARRLAVDHDRMEQLLDEVEILGLVRYREGRYVLTRAGQCLRTRGGAALPRQRRTTLV